MTEFYVVVNQHGHFANKHKEWTDGRDNKLIYRSKHKDEALNLVFELSSKDIYLRAQVLPVELDDKMHPIVTPSEVPLASDETATSIDSIANDVKQD
jgi:hypothetical protein